MVKINALSVALSLVPTLVFGQSQPVIQTPSSLVQCQPAQLTFSAGVAPYFISVLPGGQSSATPLELLPDQATAGTYTWIVNLPAGTTVTLAIRDSNGQQNFSGQLTIQEGTSSACLGATTGTGATTGATTGTGTTGAATTSSTTSSPPATTSSSSSTTTSSSSRQTSSSTTNSAPASTNTTSSGTGGNSAADSRFVLQGGVISVVAAIAGIAAFVL
ncbi:hypothetical protein BT69DRAFT_1352608 [Atractiella rhizophila]|jgi:hypothetical protein|nr:hypothetical protein BT69DRAFT_1352608 [Atractiella rhizophila]